MKRKLMLLLACLLASIGLVIAQTPKKVTGVVISEEDDQPVVGASVLVKGTTMGTVTDIDGKFTINDVPSSARTLKISYIGMKTQEIPIKTGTIRIFRSTIKELSDPKYIRFLFNPEKRTLAVQAAKRKEAECFRVPEYNPKDWDFKICSIQMQRMIWKVCDWSENATYRIAGTHYPEYNLVEFDLKQAVVVQVGESE